MNLRPEQRKYAIYRLDSTLDWISRTEDWFRRSELATRAMSLIHELGTNVDTIFTMNVDYIVTDYRNLRKYREKLNTAVDEENPEKRFEKIFEFEEWLHEIGLLKEDE